MKFIKLTNIADDGKTKIPMWINTSFLRGIRPNDNEGGSTICFDWWNCKVHDVVETPTQILQLIEKAK